MGFSRCRGDELLKGGYGCSSVRFHQSYEFRIRPRLDAKDSRAAPPRIPIFSHAPGCEGHADLMNAGDYVPSAQAIH